MANLHDPRPLIIILLAVVGAISCEIFQFPEFVAIEGGDSGAACGGWIIDKVLRPHVLTTDACVQRSHRSIRQLLVRYGSSEVTGRTSSLAVDQLLAHPQGQSQLAVLSTFGRLRRNPISQAPAEQAQRHNGTSLLCWHREESGGTLHKTLLLIEPGQYHSVEALINTLHCSSLNVYHLEGAMVLENLTPYAMLTLRPDALSTCGTSVDMLELRNITSPRSLAKMIDSPLVEPVPDNSFTFTDPNSAFGYIVYVIFMGYCILYTLMFFIFGLMRAHPSTDL
uniref:Peptidase S1 domain-containing protein n=1 Tax=Anopheles minimus TaxID=112268 RepID=A0A182WEP6_9DIPT